MSIIIYILIKFLFIYKKIIYIYIKYLNIREVIIVMKMKRCLFTLNFYLFFNFLLINQNK